MPTYLQSPTVPDQYYELDTSGDSYIILNGDPNSLLNGSTNVAIASVVNYSVKQALQNSVTGFPPMLSDNFSSRKSDIINVISRSDFLNFSFKPGPSAPSTYQINDYSFAAIVDNPLVGGDEWAEQVRVNPLTLEYSIIRNNNPLFVEAFSNFLKNTPSVQSISNSYYNQFRASALSELIGGGGFGNANLFYTFVNKTTRYGSVIRGMFGLPKYGDSGGFELYQKVGDIRSGVNNYSLVDIKCDKNCSNETWLTDVYVDTTSGTPVYYFPNGGYTTRGQQYYIEILSGYLN